MLNTYILTWYPNYKETIQFIPTGNTDEYHVIYTLYKGDEALDTYKTIEWWSEESLKEMKIRSRFYEVERREK